MKDPDHALEEKLKTLIPAPASQELRSRLESHLGRDGASEERPSRVPLRFFGIGLAAAAVVGVCAVVVFDFDFGSGSPSEASRTIGQQQILLGVLEPHLVEVAGAEPMWEIEMQILNRAIVETPERGRETILIPEKRKVFLPVTYQ